MPVVNPLARELVFKIVYYGPGLGGKTTTLQYIHATTKPEHRGKMVSLATPVDRTLYFDFLPIRVPNVRGMGVRLQLFTVPGQVYYNATRKLVLTGADGVVLVVDSQRARADANLESLDNLCDNLREHGRMLGDVPHIIAYNKRDLSDPLPIEEMEPKLNRHHAPSFGTVATQGQGVFESLEAITRLVLEEFERRIPQGRELGRQHLELPEGGLADALRRADAADVDLSVSKQPTEAAQAVSDNFRLSQIPEPDDAPGEDAARAVTEQARYGGGRDEPRPSTSPPEAVAEDDVVHAQAPRAVANIPALDEAEPARELPSEARSVARSVPPPGSQALPAAAGLSFSSLWTGHEQRSADDVEVALAARDFPRAVVLCEQLVSRTLAGAASVLGSAPEAPRDPATVALLLGLDGRSYLEFRTLVRDARAGRDIDEAEALSAYVFALQARLSRKR
jgi:signal recognition particle receptor subunit beta